MELKIEKAALNNQYKQMSDNLNERVKHAEYYMRKSEFYALTTPLLSMDDMDRRLTQWG